MDLKQALGLGEGNLGLREELVKGLGSGLWGTTKINKMKIKIIEKRNKNIKRPKKNLNQT